MHRGTFTTRDRWAGVDMGECPMCRFRDFHVDLRVTLIDRSAFLFGN